MGKGWFNLNVTEEEKSSYEFGKLKKFLSLVNFMMQDTVLTMSRESVKEFVDFMLAFCPKDTKIVNTNEVHNTFDKRHIFPDDSDYEEMPHEGIPEKELTELQRTERWLFPQFDKNRDPDPLFVLDLILRPN